MEKAENESGQPRATDLAGAFARLQEDVDRACAEIDRLRARVAELEAEKAPAKERT